MKPGKWIDDLIDSVGEYMFLETTDGVHRKGKITGFTFRDFVLNGEVARIPIEVEVNGDPTDRIPLDRVAEMTIE